MNILKSIYRNPAAKKMAVLLDPAKETERTAKLKAQEAREAKVDFLFVGGSLCGDETYNIVTSLKSASDIPVVLFPGSILQITDNADALLLLSLISGRNPELLIGQHVTAAPLLRKIQSQIIPTGYMLIEGGKRTSVEYISNSMPIPHDKPDIAVATAIAGEMLGLKLIYLEAGSGALQPVPATIIREVKKAVRIPIVVGGGIKQSEQAYKACAAGADIVVVGSAFENKTESMKHFAEAIHNYDGLK